VGPADGRSRRYGSYWPYATSLWDYVRRAMPFDNGIVTEQDVLNETTLPKVKMPNRDGFVPGPRPDFPPKKK
jgi:S-disulfanyl-L-cysteine oxidoreductase SoxD